MRAARQRARQNLPKSRGLYAATDASQGCDSLASGPAGADIRSPCEVLRVVLDTNAVLDWLVFGDAAACEVGAAITPAVWPGSLRPNVGRAARRTLQTACREVGRRTRACANYRCLSAGQSHAPSPRSPRTRSSAATPMTRSSSIWPGPKPSVLLTRDRALLALRRRAATFGVLITTAAAWRPPRVRDTLRPGRHEKGGPKAA